MAKKSNQKIKLLYLMKILLENTDDEHGMTLYFETAQTDVLWEAMDSLFREG